MSASLPPSERFSPDDALPPVEPPSAGFIVQLFVVPGVIVIVIIMVWLMFNWLAHMGNDRDAYVRALSRNNEARWQAAYNLAEALRSERIAQQPVLTVDKKLAEQLAGILQEEMEAGSMEERMEVFLESMEQSAIAGSAATSREDLVSDDEIDRMINAEVLATETSMRAAPLAPLGSRAARSSANSPAAWGSIRRR